MGRTFFTASDDDIRAGRTTDVYFQRTREVLEATGHLDDELAAEVTTGQLPMDWPWGVLTGVEAAVRLLEGLPVDLWAMPEGTLFRPHDATGVRAPVATITGPYGRFAEYETPLLGLLCHASGVATATARVRRAAGDAPVLSFGVRRMHPAIAPYVDRAAYVGGADGVSAILSAEMLGLDAQGTMPHALVITMGDQEAAWRAFDDVIDPAVARVALVDTYLDETVESVLAAEALGERLAAVRLDTIGSRRGDFPRIVREVRWELDVRGHGHVDIFVSGGLDEDAIPALKAAGADGFGVGTTLSNAPTINFSLDLVERDGQPVAKRGKFSRRKQLLRCAECRRDEAVVWDPGHPRGAAARACPACGGEAAPLLEKLLERGKRVRAPEAEKDVRERVLAQLARLPPHGTD